MDNTKLRELIVTRMKERNLSVRGLSLLLSGKVSETTIRNLTKLRLCDRPYLSSVLPVLKELNIKLEDL